MKLVRFAVIGLGNIGKIHVDAIQSLNQAKISVICNRRGGSGQELAKSIGVTWVDDFRKAIVRDDVDAVAICTPSGMHKDIAIVAAQAGKHILVEKPLEITLPRIDAMLDAASQSNVKLTCIFQSRAKKSIQATKNAIDAGRLGKLLFANALVHWHRSPEYYSNNWRGSLKFDGGGALINQSIHSIDLLQWLVGPVKTVFGHTATCVHQIQGEDTATASVTFVNGTQGTIQAATSLGQGFPARIEIHGTRGSVYLQEGSITQWKVQDTSVDEELEMLNLDQTEDGGAQHPTNQMKHDAHQLQIEDFVQAILNNRAPLVSGLEARKSVEIIRAIYHSASANSLVSLPYEDPG
jgi:UDP-N-acetyl-2-amino-2-deoxyglucuronate dehydrogenase